MPISPKSLSQCRDKGDFERKIIPCKSDSAFISDSASLLVMTSTPPQ